MATEAAQRLLEVRNLTVGYRVDGQRREAVRNVTLKINRGKTYGLVGESGSGKTTVALAIMRYLPRAGEVVDGEIWFDDRDLLTLSRGQMNEFWGSEITFVPQDPLSALNPSLTVGEQLMEMLQHHLGMDPQEAGDRSLELLDMVRIADGDRVAASYPHQISGGMQQRVLIAMALSTEPKLLVLDEPTTSLDATTQAAILDLIRDLMRDHRTAALYVTHNLGVVAQLCDRVAVLYAGELVEDGPTADLYRSPLFPYTRGLLDSVPRLGDNKQQVRLRPIQGRIPELEDLPSGCIFRSRCPLAIEVCEEYPPLYHPSEDRTTRCHRWREIEAGEISARQPEPELVAPTFKDQAEKVLTAQGVQVRFEKSRSILDFLMRRETPVVRAVDGVDLTIRRGQTVGLVGESGSGKTTLARAIVGLEGRSAGEMQLHDQPLAPDLGHRDLEILRRLQIVFQNPQEALNPYLTVGQALRYPLMKMVGLPAGEAQAAAGRLLRAVHLTPEYAQRLPGQLSGGEKQRVAIARAFASEPELLLADEPVTSLDVSVQASILNLLNELQLENDSSYLVISHDLAVVGYLADKVAVIYLGRLMEVADAEDLFEPPYHPYTEALLSAIPLIDPAARQEHIRLEGEVPSPVDVPSGCPFHTRCPRFLGDICVEEEPPWRETSSGKRYFCHIPVEELEQDQDRVFAFSEGRR